MSSKEKTYKITSFFKPNSIKDRKADEQGEKQNIENNSILANSNDQVIEKLQKFNHVLFKFVRKDKFL